MPEPLAPSCVKRWGFWVLPIALAGCGYQPVYGGQRPSTRLAVTAAPHRTAHMAAVQAALQAVRGGLSEAGVLRPGRAYPLVVVEVLRVDEKATGVRAPAAGEPGPLGRGSAVGVVGRAWVVERPGAPPTRDTGDVRRVVRYGSAQGPRVDQLRYDEAVEAASRELGDALARRILGEPVPLVTPL